MPKGQIQQIGNEIKRMIEQRFNSKIIKIKTRLRKYALWEITIDTNILNDWWGL